MPKVTVSIPQDIYEKVKVQAERNGMSVSEYAKQAILTVVKLEESREQTLRDLEECRRLLSIRLSLGAERAKAEEVLGLIKRVLEERRFLENYMAGLKSFASVLNLMMELQAFLQGGEKREEGV